MSINLSPDTTPVRVVYILGSSHSGTTLLSLLLASNSQVFAGGHLRKHRALYTEQSGRVCGCGRSLETCRFWRKVKDRLKQKGVVSVDRAKAHDATEVELLYRAILEESGKGVICDSSLNSDYLKFLQAAGFGNIFVVHVVRDGRAVAQSHFRKKRKASGAGLFWMVSNIRKWLCYRHRKDYVLVRYEDIVRNPGKSMADLKCTIARYFEDEDLFAGADAALPLNFDNHIFSANRMRHERTPEIRFDAEYVTDTSPFQWWYRSVTMLPGILCFGYSFPRKST